MLDPILEARWEYHQKAVKATMTLGKAIKAGEIKRPESCELCGRIPTPTMVKFASGKIMERSSIVGHHWKGYDNPLDVLWICQKCNARLVGPQFHDGSMSKEQSREYVLNFAIKTHPPRSIKCKRQFTNLYGKTVKCYSWAQRGSEYCYHHRPDKSQP